MKPAAMILMGLFLTGASLAQSQPQPPTRAPLSRAADDLLAQSTRSFSFNENALTGPGADFMLDQARNAQFLLIGEAHHERDIPVFTGALFDRLWREHGFRHMAVEQDPLAVETINSNAYRGNLQRIAELSRRNPTHIGFSSDQDLALLARVSARSRARNPALWGIEQAQGANRYLEELVPLAPDAAARAEVQRLLAIAAPLTREQSGAFLHDEPRMLAWLQDLKAAFRARPGSRADFLLTSLVRSAEIYSYNRRASAEPVGLFNNTVREDLFRENFLRHYRAAPQRRNLPRVLFKMGEWHMYRGRSPAQAFTIGNFAHELAIFNGMRAYGISVIAVGGHSPTVADHPQWLQPLLPRNPLSQPIIIDLHPIRPQSAEFTGTLTDIADRWRLRDYIHAFDALVILPAGAKATWNLSGFAPR